MNTLTVKIPQHLEAALATAAKRRRQPKSALVRRALEAYLLHRDTMPASPSALELAGDLVGCFEGGPRDLSADPEHLEGSGR